MKRLSLLACLVCLFALVVQPVQAQEWSERQSEIWDIVTGQWELEKAEDLAFLDMLDPSFLGWPIGSPNPYAKDTAREFYTAEIGESKILLLDLAPLAIIVTEGTAVAHYYYTLLLEHQDQERELVSGRSTDVLTRTEDGWKYLTWVGDERAENDD